MSTIQNTQNPISNPNNLRELFSKISVGEYANTTVFSPIIDQQERQLKAIQELSANPNKG